MADIICAKCAEPWDAAGVRDASDMSRRENDRFLKGEGCPCCNFGERCSACDGSGIEYPEHPYRCKTCNDKAYVLAWSPQRAARGFKAGELYTGYHPSVRHIDASVHDNPVTLGVRKFPERFDRHQSADGWVDDWWVQCPEGCATKEHDRCTECEGRGTLLQPADEDLELEAARSEINASDEDPFDILERRGLA
jgi:hypothetical protein